MTALLRSPQQDVAHSATEAARQPSRLELHRPSGTEQAASFLSALASDGVVTFQALCTNKALQAASPAHAASLNRMRHGSLAEHYAALERLNKKGACIFFMVNRGDSCGRSSSNVRAVRAVFVDLDGSPLDPVNSCAVPPSITVESSPGRFHAYWLVRNMPLDDFKPAQQALARMFDGDLAVCDLPRLMRLPGFVHHKHGAGAEARVLSCDPSRVFDWAYLAEELSLPHAMVLPEIIPEGERNTTLFKLASASRNQGVAKEQRLQSLLKLNIDRCRPPLPEQEVRGIVERVYRADQGGTLEVPASLLTDDKFVALGWGEKLLLLLSYQRLKGRRDPEFALPWADFKHHFPRESTFGSFRKRIVDAGFLRITRPATKPRDGNKAVAGMYRLTKTR